MPVSLDPSKLESVHRAILDWYARQGRHLPWRHTRDPYAILVAEMMLQQTQVERVLPKYHELLARFPTVGSLAAASRAEVIRCWAPLGYNLRAVRLHAIAQQVVSDWDGQLPSRVEDLLRLRGIGKYTAAAVACFAHEQPVAVLDTNVRRVLARIFTSGVRGQGSGVSETGSSDGLSERAAWELAEAALPPAHAYDWNQALMDLGATICVSARPRCLLCPVQQLCDYRQGVQVVGSSGVQEGDSLRPVPEHQNARTPEHLRMVAEERGSYTVGTAATSMRTPKQRAEPYTDSRRYYRGRIVQALRALTPGQTLSFRDLGRQVKPDRWTDEVAWLAEMVAALERDGLLAVERGSAGAEVPVAEWRVGLP